MSNRNPIYYIIDAGTPEPSAMQAAVRELIDGKLVVYPTDTLYGLGADPRQPAAVEHLFQAKGRASQYSIPLVAGSREQVEDHVGTLPPIGQRLANTFWPGPLTLVVAAHSTVPGRLLGGRDSVAVRVPDHAVARGLAVQLGYPITATSANRSGVRAATTVAEAVDELGPDLALVLDGGPAKCGVPSTIVDVRTTTPVLLRPGVVPWERVLQSLS